MSAILIKHAPWKPADVEGLCGLSPVALRDLRRRGLAPESEGRTLPLNSVAQLLLQTELAQHGLGPKSVQPFVEKHAPAIVAFALSRPSSWADESAYRSWKKGISKKNADRFAVLTNSADVSVAQETLRELNGAEGPAVMTVVDLFYLGNKLADELSVRPSRVSVIGKAEKK